jgi:Putative antitoxin of bacterial toxin-antitoxin system, YdaS/YdaT
MLMAMTKRRKRKAPPPPPPVDARAVAILDAIRAEYGMISKIGRELGIARQAVAQWEMVPLEWVIKVERVTGIPRERLRPDFHR